VARATSAATTFFKSIKLGRDQIEFVDAGFGYNNPTQVLIDEARRQFPGHDRLRILSVGTGMGDVVTIKDTRRSILVALKKMATASKKVAFDVEHRYSNYKHHTYHRFNVSQGLQDTALSDCGAASSISAHTGNYLRENAQSVLKFVQSFVWAESSGASASEGLLTKAGNGSHETLSLGHDQAPRHVVAAGLDGTTSSQSILATHYAMAINLLTYPRSDCLPGPAAEPTLCGTTEHTR
jgi:hypothetical protein